MYTHEDTYVRLLIYSYLITGEPGSGTPACGEQDFFFWSLWEFVGVRQVKWECGEGSGSG